MDYHSGRFQDYSLIVLKEGKMVAVLPANLSSEKLFSHQGLTYGGLVFSEALKFNQILKIFESILSFLHTNKIKRFYLKLLPSIYTNYPNDELLYIMFLIDAKLVRRDSLSVINNLNKIKFSKDRIEGVKRGKNNNLIVKEEQMFDAFWKGILIPNLSKKHNTKPVHSLEEITFLKNGFPSQIRQFNVYKDNVIVAGTTIFETENVAHSQYISGDENKNSLGSLDFLHEYLINSVFNNKPYFDFGISNENEGKNINQGLQYWKEGFGARTIVQDFYSINTANYYKLAQVMI